MTSRQGQAYVARKFAVAGKWLFTGLVCSAILWCLSPLWPAVPVLER